MDESLQSTGLKDAVANLKEVAKEMKENSIKMQNATLALLGGQNGLESQKDNKNKCKRFKWNRFKRQKCMGRHGRSPKLNVKSKHVQNYFVGSYLIQTSKTLLHRGDGAHKGL